MIKTTVLGLDPPFYKMTGRRLFNYSPPPPPPPSPRRLKRWSLVGVAPFLSGVETEKKY